MKALTIKTSKGIQPITVLPNNMLCDAYLNEGGAEEAEYIRLLTYALPDPEEAGKVLRKAITSGREFYAYYPGVEGSKEPAGSALYIGGIPDGSLYLL